MRRERLILAAILTAFAALAGCGSRSAEAPRKAYVDPAICASCHAEIARSYRETGMGRSFYRPSTSVLPSGGAFYHIASDRYYEFSSHGDAFFLHRHQLGFEQRNTNEVEKSVDFVVGSGNHARTYLHRNPDGRLFELPVSWYAEKGGYLAMSPGYDEPRQEDFRRAVPDECLFCHNGYPRSGVAEGIDCQRCHGPGGAHVAAASGKARPEQIRAAIVNPVRLDRNRQLDVCMQCHLETTSLRLPNAIRNFKRTPFSYIPGEALTNYEQFFDRTPGAAFDDRFEVAHQAYRLRRSACYRNSAMTCTTCHNPHEEPRGEAATQHYLAVCSGCHSGVHASGMPSGGSNCLDCHMWKRRTEDAVHVVMTDHFIQRHRPSRDLLAPLPEKPAPYRGEVIAYYPERPENELYLNVAQVQHESNLEAGVLRLERALAQDNPDEPEFFVELGKAQSKAGKVNESIASFKEALRRRGGFQDALRELAAAYALSGNWARAIEAGERACAQQPPDLVALTNLGNAYLRNGNPDRAKENLARAFSIDPDLPDAQNLFGLAWLAQRNSVSAEASFRHAIAAQPDMAEAHNNLANLLAGAGKRAEAGYHFQKALSANPGYTDAHHSYGLLLVLMNDLGGALRQLQEAVTLDPGVAQLHIDYGDMLL